MKPFYPFFVYNCFLLNSAEVILVRCHFSHFEIFLMFPQVIIKNINEYTKEMSKSWSTAFLKHQKKERWGTKQEAHRQRFTHLSEIATADTGMQMLCNIFPILSLQLMKGSSFEQVLVLKKKNVFFIIIILKYMGMTVNGAWPFEQTLNPVSIVGLTWNLVEIGQLISEDKVFNNIMILYMYTA